MFIISLLYFLLIRVGVSVGSTRTPESFRKVVVPATYHEYQDGNFPDWIASSDVHKKYDYSVFLYQKMNSSRPNYIPFNRGTEAGVYLRYIVDHYHHFPDVAIFVHAKPEDHNSNWLNAVKCVRKNATYMNINFNYLTRDTDYWNYLGPGYEMWVEQCWREVLKVVWRLENNTAEFHRRVPVSFPVSTNFSCCQQFVLGRTMVHRRPLSMWKRLLTMIGEQTACKLGEPDYEHLHAYFNHNRSKIGPEPQSSALSTVGIATQGGAMEHLAHVVYGHQPLVMPPLTMEDICAQFHPQRECGVPSPCEG